MVERSDTELAAEVASRLADNTSGDISAADVRAVVGDLIDSKINNDDRPADGADGAPGAPGAAGAPGPAGPAGADGSDGAGLEYRWAAQAADTTPAAPSNDLGFGATADPWQTSLPSLSTSTPALWAVTRRVAGTPDAGDAVAGQWSTPALIGRLQSGGGGTGEDGEDGLGYEVVWTIFNSGTTAPQTPQSTAVFGGQHTVGTDIHWRQSPESMTTASPFLWRTQRPVSGTPEQGDDIGDVSWETPALVGRLAPTPSAASTEAAGIVEFATLAEARARSAADRAITPAGLNSALNALGGSPDILLVGFATDRIYRYDGSAWDSGVAVPTGENFPGGIAVDPSTGDILMAGASTDRVYRYDGSAWDSGLALPPNTGAPSGLAVDPSTGDILMGEADTDRVYRYDGSAWNSGLAIPPNTGFPAGVAVDPSTGDILIVDGTTDRFYRYDGSAWDSGTELPTNLTIPTGLAVDPSTGDILVSDSSSDLVYRYDGSAWDSGSALPTNESAPSGLSIYFRFPIVPRVASWAKAGNAAVVPTSKLGTSTSRLYYTRYAATTQAPTPSPPDLDGATFSAGPPAQVNSETLPSDPAGQTWYDDPGDPSGSDQLWSVHLTTLDGDGDPAVFAGHPAPYAPPDGGGGSGTGEDDVVVRAPRGAPAEGDIGKIIVDGEHAFFAIRVTEEAVAATATWTELASGAEFTDSDGGTLTFRGVFYDDAALPTSGIQIGNVAWVVDRHEWREFNQRTIGGNTYSTWRLFPAPVPTIGTVRDEAEATRRASANGQYAEWAGRMYVSSAYAAGTPGHEIIEWVNLNPDFHNIDAVRILAQRSITGALFASESIGLSPLGKRVRASLPPAPPSFASIAAGDNPPVAGTGDIGRFARLASATAYDLARAPLGGPNLLGQRTLTFSTATRWAGTGLVGWSDATEIEFRVGAGTASSRQHHRVSVATINGLTPSTDNTTAFSAQRVGVAGVFAAANEEIFFGRTAGNELLIAVDNASNDLSPITLWAVHTADVQEGGVRFDVNQTVGDDSQTRAQLNIGGPFMRATGGQTFESMAVRFDAAQDLTVEQQSRARSNIAAAPDVSGAAAGTLTGPVAIGARQGYAHGAPIAADQYSANSDIPVNVGPNGATASYVDVWISAVQPTSIPYSDLVFYFVIGTSVYYAGTPDADGHFVFNASQYDPSRNHLRVRVRNAGTTTITNLEIQAQAYRSDMVSDGEFVLGPGEFALSGGSYLWFFNGAHYALSDIDRVVIGVNAGGRQRAFLVSARPANLTVYASGGPETGTDERYGDWLVGGWSGDGAHFEVSADVSAGAAYLPTGWPQAYSVVRFVRQAAQPSGVIGGLHIPRHNGSPRSLEYLKLYPRSGVVL